MWRSANTTVQDGLIAGSNAVTGVGLMFEQSAPLENSWGLARNVQVHKLGGCCFSAYGGTNIQYQNAECRDNHHGHAGRDRGDNGGLMFYAGWEDPSHFGNGCCACSNISYVESKW